MPAHIVDIPWPLNTAPGAVHGESGGRLINAYATPMQGAPRVKARWSRCPGLTQRAITGVTGAYRGGIFANGLLFVVIGTRVLSVDSGFNVTNIGALPGTRKVTAAKNNKQPTADVVFVDPDNGAYLVTSVTVTSYNAGGNLPQPNSVCFQDGYFFFTIGDRRVFNSDLNATTVNALGFTTLQSRSSGSLLRGVAYKGLLFLFTDKSCEIFNDTANAAPAFPYSRLAVADRGLLAAACIAGHDDGFGYLVWVGDDSAVYRFTPAYQPEKISTPDLDRLISNEQILYPGLTSMEAGCYIANGRAAWHLSATSWTWEFGTNSETWNERMSFTSGEASGGPLSRWRGSGGISAYGQWLLGDVQTGNIVGVDPRSYMEVNAPQLFRMESGPVSGFPNRLRVGRVDFDVMTGVGRTSLPDPVCMISWSDDDGGSWSNPVIRPLGARAHTSQRVTVLGVGKTGAAGRRWRYDVTDAVYAGLEQARMSADPRAN